MSCFKRAHAIGVITLLCLADGCTPSTKTPIPSTTHVAAEPPPVCLMVMLPGRGDLGESYSDNDVVARVQKTQPAVEVVTVDAHFGYYRKRNLLPRLEQDVVVPAEARGQQQIWLVGTSMGGLGALLMAQEHPDQIDGIILMAPYLGRKGNLKNIEDAGGLASWQPPEDLSEWDVSLWAWLKGYTAGEPRPPIYLAYGTQDGGAPAHELLADALPQEHVYRAEGGHGWDVWNPLWDELLGSAAPFCSTPPSVDATSP